MPDDVAHLFAAVGRHDQIVGAIERRFGGLVDSLTLRGDGVGEVPPDLVQDIRRVPHRYAGCRSNFRRWTLNCRHTSRNPGEPISSPVSIRKTH